MGYKYFQGLYFLLTLVCIFCQIFRGLRLFIFILFTEIPDSINQFTPVKQSRQQALRAYCPHMYTVYTAHVENEFSQENIFFLSFPSIDFLFFYDHHYALVYSFIHNKDDTASFLTTLY